MSKLKTVRIESSRKLAGETSLNWIIQEQIRFKWKVIKVQAKEHGWGSIDIFLNRFIRGNVGLRCWINSAWTPQ